MTSLEPGAIRIETRSAGAAVHVGVQKGAALLMIGEPGAADCRVAALSPEQAEMVLHALGLTVARIREEERARAEDRAGLEKRLLDQEVRFGGR